MVNGLWCIFHKRPIRGSISGNRLYLKRDCKSLGGLWLPFQRMGWFGYKRLVLPRKHNGMLIKMLLDRHYGYHSNSLAQHQAMKKSKVLLFCRFSHRWRNEYFLGNEIFLLKYRLPWEYLHRNRQTVYEYLEKKRIIKWALSFIKNWSKLFITCSNMAGVERLELSRTVLETDMLPLHHTPMNNHVWYYIIIFTISQ